MRFTKLLLFSLMLGAVLVFSLAVAAQNSNRKSSPETQASAA